MMESVKSLESRPTAIITGIKGQDGTILRTRLERRSYQVLGTSRCADDKAPIKLAGSSCEIDIAGLVSVLKQCKPKTLFHFASENRSLVDVDSYIEHELYMSNVRLTELILEAVLAYSPDTHIVLVGSSQQFCVPNTQVVTSTSPQNPRNYYAWTKLRNQQQASSYRKKGLSITYAILFNHDSWARKPGFLVPSMASQILRCKLSSSSIPLQSEVALQIREPTAAFDLSSAHDTVNILLMLAELRLSIDTTIGSQSSCSIPYLAQCMQDLTGVKVVLNDGIIPRLLLQNSMWMPHPLASNEYQKFIGVRPKRCIRQICREILGFLSYQAVANR